MGQKVGSFYRRKPAPKAAKKVQNRRVDRKVVKRPNALMGKMNGSVPRSTSVSVCDGHLLRLSGVLGQ